MAGEGVVRVQIVAKRLDASSINAMHHVYKIKPESGGLDPAISLIHEMRGSSPRMTVKVFSGLAGIT